MVEQGTHEELYAVPDSVYHSLVQLQEQATDRREALAAAAGDLEAAAAADEEEAAGIAAQHAAQELPGRSTGSSVGVPPAGRGSGRRTSSQVEGGVGGSHRASAVSKRKGKEEKLAGGKPGPDSGDADAEELVRVHPGIDAG